MHITTQWNLILLLLKVFNSRKDLKLRADFLYGSHLKPNCGPGYNLHMEFKEEFYKSLRYMKSCHTN